LPPFLYEEMFMGLFSNKTKIEVSTTVTRVVEDNLLPETAKSAAVRAIFNDENLSEAMLAGLSRSIALKADRMYRWAGENYHYGLPNSTLVSNITGKDVVQDIIEGELNAPITIEYFEYAPANSLHMGWEALINDHGYDPVTNILGTLSAEKGVTVYLKDMQAVYTEETFKNTDAGTLEQWGTPATKGYTPERLAQLNSPLGNYRSQSTYIVDSRALVDYIEVTYVYEEVTGSVEIATFTLPMIGYNPSSEYYHVKFSYTPAGASEPVLKYWSYEDGSGGYGSIDNIYLTDFNEIGHFMPNIYFRLEDQNVSKKEERWYPPHITTTKLCKFLGYEYQKFGDDLHSQEGSSGYEQVYMTMGVPLTTDVQIEMQYLFDYFSLLYYNTPVASGVSSFSDFTPRNGQAIKISDKAFTTTLSHQGIAKRRIAGKLGKIGFCETGERTIGHVEGYSVRGIGGVLAPTTKVVNTQCHYFRKQVSDIFYEEVAVYGASLRYHIYGSHHVVATTNDGKLLIPLDHAITSVVPIMKREELFSRSFHLVFNTVTITEEKWYASSAFRIIVIIVAIAICYFSAGGLSGISASLVSLGTMTMTAMAIAALENIAIAMALKFGSEYLVSEFGAEMGMAGAILMTAAAIYLSQGTDPSSISWGENLLAASNSMLTASNDAIAEMGNAFNDLTQEFSLMMDAQAEEMKAAQKLLGTDLTLNPFDFIGRETVFIDGESPDDFYYRTIHAGNVGATGITAQSNYVANALRLPSFAETMRRE